MQFKCAVLGVLHAGSQPEREGYQAADEEYRQQMIADDSDKAHLRQHELTTDTSAPPGQYFLAKLVSLGCHETS